MSKVRVEIIAIGEEKIYSVGAVEVTHGGEVFIF